MSNPRHPSPGRRSLLQAAVAVPAVGAAASVLGTGTAQAAPRHEDPGTAGSRDRGFDEESPASPWRCCPTRSTSSTPTAPTPSR